MEDVNHPKVDPCIIKIPYTSGRSLEVVWYPSVFPRIEGNRSTKAYAMATILHVEDNYENRILMRRLLKAEGYDLVEAENATQAFEKLKTVKPDLILMDINMPDVDGYTLTNQIKAIPGFEKIPIVAITANVMKGDRERTLSAGCDGYIEKPIDVDKISMQIARFLS
jgi:two-component system, cell cycle response regulator DivK